MMLYAEENDMGVRMPQAATRVVALISAVSGALMVVSRWTSYGYAPIVLRESVAIVGVPLTLVPTAHLLVPILKIAVGLCLWGVWRRAWAFAVIVLSADVLLLVSSIVRFHLGAGDGFSRELVEGARASAVQVHSLWPSYVIATLSLISLFVLMQGPVRRQWARKTGAA
jgi:hypothetical protein